jgi:arginine/lysine/ornithine decarboxylase
MAVGSATTLDMDHSRAPLLDAIGQYHDLDRYGFTPPGHRQGRGADPLVRDVLGIEPFRYDVLASADSMTAPPRRVFCSTPRS